MLGNNGNPNQMGNPAGAVTVPAQVFNYALGGEAIEAIGKYAVEAHEQKHMPPLEWSQKFCINKEEGKTYIYKENDRGKGGLVEFFDTIIEEIIEIYYVPQLYFDDGRLLIFTINKKPEMLFVKNSYWGKKEMLQLLRNHGIVFRICRSPSLLLSNLMDYLAELRATKYIRLDPRAGWVRCSNRKKEVLYPELIGVSIQSETEYKWKFQMADVWLFDIPAIAASKTLLQEKYELEELENAFQWKLADGEESSFILLLSLLFIAINFSRLREKCKLVQEKFIVINCSSQKVFQILKLFFSFYIEDEVKNLTLSMLNKDLKKTLMQSKDQLIVIDADAEDISGRRKQNIALLKNFVSSGGLPDGQKSEAIVILLSRGIAEGVAIDDSIVFNIDEKDINFLILTEINQIRCRTAKMIQFFINTIEKCADWFEEIFKSDLVKSDFCNLLKLSAKAVMQIEVINKVISQPQIILKEVNKKVETAKEFAEIDGYSGIFADIVLQKILDKSKIVLRLSKERIDKQELKYTILMDKKALYLSDEILENNILPEIASADIKSVVLRKKLAHEGLILVYQSESGSKTYKKKRPLRSLDEQLYQCWMTAIDRSRIEELTEVNFDDLMEEMNHGK